jgi:hypothetical protein
MKVKSIMDSNYKLVGLYQEMSKLSAGICANECLEKWGTPTRCCDPEYCEVARRFAKEKYDIDLVETGHRILPFMGSNGCTVAPHLRPICTIHVCPLDYMLKPEFAKDYERTEIYRQLRKEILAEAKAENQLPEDKSGVWNG